MTSPWWTAALYLTPLAVAGVIAGLVGTRLAIRLIRKKERR